MRYDNEQMAQSAASGSVRLIFEYEGDAIRLVSQQDVDVTPPPGHPTTAAEDQMGFWMEVRDPKLQVLHRQVMSDPVMTNPEVFSNEPGKTITRSEKTIPKGAFTVLVPRIPDSDHLAFVRMDPGVRAESAGKLRAPAGEIARFSLKPQPETETKSKPRSQTKKKKSSKEKTK
ncbi:MAG: hypothetical protein WBV94_22640 [Blastocatellia bacterium]